MFTSYYYNPKEIFVFPHLRESDGNDTDTVIETDIRYPMKSIREQKEYLSSKNINNINFEYVEKSNERSEPGNIKKFLEWFGKNVKLPEKDIVNVLVIIHNNMQSRFSSNELWNNAGFILSTTCSEDIIEYKKDNLLSLWYSNYNTKSCPSKRCPGVCKD